LGISPASYGISDDWRNMMSPEEVVDDRRESTQSRRRTDASSLLLPIPSLREELREEKQPYQPDPMDHIVEECEQRDDSLGQSDSSTSSCDTKDTSKYAVETVMVPPEAIKLNERTILAPIEEDCIAAGKGMHAVIALWEKVNKLLVENQKLSDQMFEFRRSSDERTTPFQNVFEEVRGPRWSSLTSDESNTLFALTNQSRILRTKLNEEGGELRKLRREHEQLLEEKSVADSSVAFLKAEIEKVVQKAVEIKHAGDRKTKTLENQLVEASRRADKAERRRKELEFKLADVLSSQQQVKRNKLLQK
jgi:hypothetical protein